MAGLYFHIPFCKRICAYCDFYRFADLRGMADVLQAMHAELEETRGFLHDRSVRSVYFGGGTPSLAAPAELQRFIDHAADIYDLQQSAEITAEVNPDDITREYVAALRRTDLNRISIGIQSFDDRVLQLMNRRHTAGQGEDAVKRLQDAGFDNITADMIFGIDGFGDEVVRRDLECMTALGVRHVSAYHLTIEPSTRFGLMEERGELRAIDEAVSERLFAMIHHTLTAAGFEHYEVSNYALEGFRSRHNSSYWDGTEYLGTGPGAHSYNGEQRRWCRQRPGEYAAARSYEWELLDERDRFNETVMTSLRRIEGLDLETVERHFGRERAERLRSEAAKLTGYGVECTERQIKIAPERMLTSDSAIAALFEA